jgi:hypothetical protein
MTNQLTRKTYPSEVTEAQGKIRAPGIPEPAAAAAREPLPRREIVHGIL